MRFKRLINVLIAEDSLTTLEYLRYILSSDPEIGIIGTVSDGHQAVEFVRHQKPDVIVMDINMPVLDGFQATQQIMETQAVPIILISAIWNPAETTTSFKAMEAGAVAVLQKPRGFGAPDAEQLQQELIRQVKLMSEVRVVTRRRKASSTQKLMSSQATTEPPVVHANIRLVAIGASTGGPPVLQAILTGLAKDFPAPILIVQHIAKGFITGLTQWMQQTTGFPVHVATQGERVTNGHVYFAPDDIHMGVQANGRIVMTKSERDNGLRPSVTHLFRSVVQSYRRSSIGVLLTGMGADGAAELKKMKDIGAITIAQDKASSLVHGMPGVAIQLRGATYVLSPPEIVATLEKLVRKKAK